jgi:hypothetical protein
LYTATDGFLIAIAKANKQLLVAATRLREEGYPDDAMVVVIDNMNIGQPLAGRISDLLRPPRR